MIALCPKWGQSIKLGTLRSHDWVHSKSNQYFPQEQIKTTFMGTFSINPTFAHWAHWSHLLSVLPMYPACAWWVFGSLSPVSESLRQFTCACCAKSVNISDRKVRRLEETNSELMRDRTSHIFNENCIPPEVPFTDGPLAGLMIDPNGVIPETPESGMVAIIPLGGFSVGSTTNVR